MVSKPVHSRLRYVSTTRCGLSSRHWGLWRIILHDVCWSSDWIDPYIDARRLRSAVCDGWNGLPFCNRGHSSDCSKASKCSDPGAGKYSIDNVPLKRLMKLRFGLHCL